MTVKELIETLEKIDNKDLDVVMAIESDIELVDNVTEEFEAYYGKTDNTDYVWATRKCVILG